MPGGTEFELIRSNRRTISLEISRDGRLIVRCPYRTSSAYIQELVNGKRQWIEKHTSNIQAMPAVPKLTTEQLSDLAKRASKVIPERVVHFAPSIGVTFGRITIRRQRTKWGSCSSKGNLNFNVLLMLAPPDVLDYIVVHELCHRRELNHSAHFWSEVEKVMPDYREKEMWLKENGGALMDRLPER